MISTPKGSGVDEQPSRQGDRQVAQFVGFRLGDTDYAIPITRAREIILMPPITRIPQVPDHIEGLINLRGLVIPLINLRARLGLPHRAFDEDTRTIVVTVGDRFVGCVVDAVTAVVRATADQLRPAPIAVAAGPRGHISGLAKLDDRLLIVLDLDNLLGSDVSEPAPTRAIHSG